MLYLLISPEKKMLDISNQYLILVGTFILLSMGMALIVFVIIFQQRQLKYRIAQQLEIQKLQEEMQRKLLENSLQVQEEVRRTVAKNLHDEVGAMLSATKMGFNMLTRKIKDDADTYEQFGKAKALLEDSISSVRRISKELLPSTLEKFGLVPATEDFFQKITSSSIIQIEFESNLNPDERLNGNKELMLFRIIQELTNNALKHAEASNLTIRLNKDLKQIELDFVDNGKGFDVLAVEKNPSSGLGLNNIKSRVSVVKGDYSLVSKPNEGTIFKIRVPV